METGLASIGHYSWPQLIFVHIIWIKIRLGNRQKKKVTVETVKFSLWDRWLGFPSVRRRRQTLSLAVEKFSHLLSSESTASDTPNLVHKPIPPYLLFLFPPSSSSPSSSLDLVRSPTLHELGPLVSGPPLSPAISTEQKLVPVPLIAAALVIWISKFKSSFQNLSKVALQPFTLMVLHKFRLQSQSFLVLLKFERSSCGLFSW